MADPTYLRIDLPPTASPLAVVHAAVLALRPDTRAVCGLRPAHKRLSRQMLWAHAARQAAGDKPTG